MGLMILGKNTDDKGAQLENLTRQLLESLGYQRIGLNRTGTAGELDITGEHVIPMPGRDTVIPLIGECKARQDAIGTTDWLKFLGKMYVKEAGGKRFTGVFVALSGANGNVQESYREMARENVRLVDHTTLTEYLAKSHGLATVQAILGVLPHVTDRVAWKIEVAYYDGRAYWVVFYDDHEYSVLDAKGGHLAAEALVGILELIQSETTARTFVDLAEERKGKLLARSAAAAVVAAIMQGDGIAAIDGVLGFADVVPEGLLRDAFEKLIQNKWFQREADGRIGFRPEVLTQTSELARIFVFLLEGRVLMDVDNRAMIPLDEHIFLRAIGCEWYDRHINNDMVAEACRVQLGLTLNPHEIETAVKLMRWSPAALLYALHPDPIITQHRKDMPFESERLNGHDRGRFMRSLHVMLINDFNRPQLSKYFLKVRGLSKMIQTLKVDVYREQDHVHGDTMLQTSAVGELGMAGFEGVCVPMIGIEGLPSPLQ